MTQPEKFGSEYYDEKYFADKDGKTFHRSDGSIDHWGYRNPEGEWLGCKPITEAWKIIFNPKNMLDVGCGRGPFVAYARDIGIEAEGFDFSEWAISNPYPRCKKEWIKIHDAVQRWPYPDKKFDLVVILDLFEHMYIDDIEFAVNEMYRCANKWVFLQIAVSGSGGLQGNTSYILNKDSSVPVELEMCAVAGHVTVQPESFWYKKLNRSDWILRKDIVNQFCSTVPNDVIANWLLNSIIVMERI